MTLVPFVDVRRPLSTPLVIADLSGGQIQMFDVISWLDENETRSRILSTSLAVVVGVDKIYTLREDCLLSMLKSYMEIGHFRLFIIFLFF